MGSRGATLGDVMLAEIKARRVLAARRLARQWGYQIVDGKWIQMEPSAENGEAQEPCKRDPRPGPELCKRDEI